MVRALGSHQCVPGSIPAPGVICGLSLLLVLYSAPRGFSGFPLSSKTNISEFHLQQIYIYIYKRTVTSKEVRGTLFGYQVYKAQPKSDFTSSRHSITQRPSHEECGHRCALSCVITLCCLHFRHFSVCECMYGHGRGRDVFFGRNVILG